jgi:hypothetical protein
VRLPAPRAPGKSGAHRAQKVAARVQEGASMSRQPGGASPRPQDKPRTARVKEGAAWLEHHLPVRNRGGARDSAAGAGEQQKSLASLQIEVDFGYCIGRRPSR